MATLLVSGHSGAHAWAMRQGLEVEVVTHLAIDRVRAGDVVIGNLPCHLAAGVCARGARFVAIEMNVSADERRRELTADDMERNGARLVEYRVEAVGAFARTDGGDR